MNIRGENLSFSYIKRQKNIIDCFNFEIKQGTVTVLLGLNGSGKTTLIKLLAGLELPTEGKIFYGDKNLKNISMRNRSKLFSYVPQHLTFINNIVVEQFLSYGKTNSLLFFEHPGKKELEIVHNIAKSLKITHLLNNKINEISGGELQIVLIASALIQETPIIFLDEPTSALDIKNQFLVLSTLKEIAASGKTVILSSHNPNHALFLDSNVIIIHDGQIYKQGKAKELINKSELSIIYGDHLILSNELDYNELSFK